MLSKVYFGKSQILQGFKESHCFFLFFPFFSIFFYFSVFFLFFYIFHTVFNCSYLFLTFFKYYFTVKNCNNRTFYTKGFFVGLPGFLGYFSGVGAIFFITTRFLLSPAISVLIVVIYFPPSA